MSEQETALVKCATPECQNMARKGISECRSCETIRINKEAKKRHKEAEEKAQIKARETQKVRQATARLKEHANSLTQKKDAEASERFDSKEVPNKSKAHDIIRESWSRDVNVIEQVYTFGLETARDLRLSPNAYYWRVGPSRMQEAIIADEQLEAPELPETWERRAECLDLSSLYALWAFATTGKTIQGQSWSFEGWLEHIRDRQRKDLWFLGKDILRIPFDELHRELTENLYPKFLNVSYPEDYDLSYEHDLITNVCETKEYLCLMPRGYLKSAAVSAFALQFMLNFPNSSVFTLSGTAPLALGFLRIQRSYLSKTSGATPSDFHLSFPEYAMHDLDVRGETPLTLPCRKFEQKDFSFRTAGVEGQTSSVHSELLILDDAVQEAGSEISRPKLKDLLDSLASNIPNAGSFKVWCGTRYHLNDYYSHLIEMVNEDPTALRFVCKGAARPRLGYSHISWDKLELDQVDLLWPGKIGSSPEKTWNDLKKKIKRNLNDFMCQQQNDPQDTVNPDDIICFDPDLVMAHVKDRALFPREGDRYVVVDVSYSTDNRADFGVIACANEALNDANPGVQSLYFTEIEAKRRSNSDLALAIAETCIRYAPIKHIVLEKVNGVDLLISEARRLAMQRGFTLPEVDVVKIDLTKRAKWNRIKNSQMLMAADRIFISDKCESIALVIDQYCKYNGKPSNQYRKDDCPDCVALLALRVLHPINESPESLEAREERDRLYEQRSRMAAQYERVFGNHNVATSVPTDPEEYAGGGYQNPILRALSKDTRPRPTKTISFAIMNRPAVKR